MAIFEIVGAVILWISAFFTLKQSAKANVIDFTYSVLKNRRSSFITGFSLALTNPMIVFG
jgi:hypothetical protein